MENQDATKFMTINEFKSEIGKVSEPVQIVKSPKSGKLFMSIGSDNFKCQQTFTNELPFKIIVPITEDGELNLEEACLTNVKETQNNVLFTL